MMMFDLDSQLLWQTPRPRKKKEKWYVCLSLLNVELPADSVVALALRVSHLRCTVMAILVKAWRGAAFTHSSLHNRQVRVVVSSRQCCCGSH